MSGNKKQSNQGGGNPEAGGNKPPRDEMKEIVEAAKDIAKLPEGDSLRKGLEQAHQNRLDAYNAKSKLELTKAQIEQNELEAKLNEQQRAADAAAAAAVEAQQTADIKQAVEDYIKNPANQEHIASLMPVNEQAGVAAVLNDAKATEELTQSVWQRARSWMTGGGTATAAGFVSAAGAKSAIRLGATAGAVAMGAGTAATVGAALSAGMLGGGLVEGIRTFWKQTKQVKNMEGLIEELKQPDLPAVELMYKVVSINKLKEEARLDRNHQAFEELEYQLALAQRLVEAKHANLEKGSSQKKKLEYLLGLAKSVNTKAEKSTRKEVKAALKEVERAFEYDSRWEGVKKKKDWKLIGKAALRGAGFGLIGSTLGLGAQALAHSGAFEHAYDATKAGAASLKEVANAGLSSAKENLFGASGIKLKAGQSIWSVAKEYLHHQGIPHPTNTQTLELAKKLATESGVKVDEWGLHQGLDHHHLPKDFVVKGFDKLSEYARPGASVVSTLVKGHADRIPDLSSMGEKITEVLTGPGLLENAFWPMITSAGMSFPEQMMHDERSLKKGERAIHRSQKNFDGAGIISVYEAKQQAAEAGRLAVENEAKAIKLLSELNAQMLEGGAPGSAPEFVYSSRQEQVCTSGEVLAAESVLGVIAAELLALKNKSARNASALAGLPVVLTNTRTEKKPRIENRQGSAGEVTVLVLPLETNGQEVVDNLRKELEDKLSIELTPAPTVVQPVAAGSPAAAGPKKTPEQIAREKAEKHLEQLATNIVHGANKVLEKNYSKTEAPYFSKDGTDIAASHIVYSENTLNALTQEICVLRDSSPENHDKLKDVEFSLVAPTDAIKVISGKKGEKLLDIPLGNLGPDEAVSQLRDALSKFLDVKNLSAPEIKPESAEFKALYKETGPLNQLLIDKYKPHAAPQIGIDNVTLIGPEAQRGIDSSEALGAITEELITLKEKNVPGLDALYGRSFTLHNLPGTHTIGFETVFKDRGQDNFGVPVPITKDEAVKQLHAALERDLGIKLDTAPDAVAAERERKKQEVSAFVKSLNGKLEANFGPGTGTEIQIETPLEESTHEAILASKERLEAITDRLVELKNLSLDNAKNLSGKKFLVTVPSIKSTIGSGKFQGEDVIFLPLPIERDAALAQLDAVLTRELGVQLEATPPAPEAPDADLETRYNEKGRKLKAELVAAGFPDSLEVVFGGTNNTNADKEKFANSAKPEQLVGWIGEYFSNKNKESLRKYIKEVHFTPGSKSLVESLMPMTKNADQVARLKLPFDGIPDNKFEFQERLDDVLQQRHYEVTLRNLVRSIGSLKLNSLPGANQVEKLRQLDDWYDTNPLVGFLHLTNLVGELSATGGIGSQESALADVLKNFHRLHLNGQNDYDNQRAYQRKYIFSSLNQIRTVPVTRILKFDESFIEKYQDILPRNFETLAEQLAGNSVVKEVRFVTDPANVLTPGETTTIGIDYFTKDLNSITPNTSPPASPASPASMASTTTPSPASAAAPPVASALATPSAPPTPDFVNPGSPETPRVKLVRSVDSWGKTKLINKDEFVDAVGVDREEDVVRSLFNSLGDLAEVIELGIGFVSGIKLVKENKPAAVKRKVENFIHAFSRFDTPTRNRFRNRYTKGIVLVDRVGDGYTPDPDKFYTDLKGDADAIYIKLTNSLK